MAAAAGPQLPAPWGRRTAKAAAMVASNDGVRRTSCAGSRTVLALEARGHRGAVPGRALASGGPAWALRGGEEGGSHFREGWK